MPSTGSVNLTDTSIAFLFRWFSITKPVVHESKDRGSILEK